MKAAFFCLRCTHGSAQWAYYYHYHPEYEREPYLSQVFNLHDRVPY